jgi:rhodanese-related sulfurtransferase
MGVSVSIEKLSACDIKYIQQTKTDKYLFITTLNDEYKNYPLIKGTLHPYSEEKHINLILRDKKNNTNRIIIYGKNSQDDSAIDKYKQLLSLGITNIYIYTGGLFEWLLLNKQYPSVFLTDDLNNTITNYNIWGLCEKPNKDILK